MGTEELTPTLEPLQLRHQARPSALAATRASLRNWLEQVGASEREVYEVTVACNEACSNSIEHPLRRPGADYFEVEADCVSGELELVVRDFGRWRDRGPSGDRGRGLVFIDELMDSVQVRSSEQGTEVRMRRRLETADRTALGQRLEPLPEGDALDAPVAPVDLELVHKSVDDHQPEIVVDLLNGRHRPSSLSDSLEHDRH